MVQGRCRHGEKWSDTKCTFEAEATRFTSRPELECEKRNGRRPEDGEEQRGHGGTWGRGKAGCVGVWEARTHRVGDPSGASEQAAGCRSLVRGASRAGGRNVGLEALKATRLGSECRQGRGAGMEPWGDVRLPSGRTEEEPARQTENV